MIGQELRKHLPGARRHHVAKSEEWLKQQAQRLGVDPESILAAIKRGHLPNRIEKLAASSPLVSVVFHGEADRKVA